MEFVLRLFADVRTVPDSRILRLFFDLQETCVTHTNAYQYKHKSYSNKIN